MPSDLNITKRQTSATGQKQGKSSLNIMPQQKLQTLHWTAAIMKTPGQQRLAAMKEALNEPKCKNNLLQEHWYITNTHMHRESQMCVRKMFFTSFVPQPAENNTFTLLRGASLGQIRECPPT